MVLWETYNLKELCDFNQYSYSSKDKWNFINYLDTGNITENKINEIQLLNPKIDKIPSRAKRKVKVNDIIYSTVRPNQKHYGIIKEKISNLLVSTGFVVISAKEKINSDFLYNYLTQYHITESLHNIAEQSTSAYPSIKPLDVGNIEIFLPPLSTVIISFNCKVFIVYSYCNISISYWVFSYHWLQSILKNFSKRYRDIQIKYYANRPKK